ncbi:MAG: epoxyqueuosine reductase [Bacteroidetes bacterium]|nr:epoxyqueuosine reductase [Bacteroidota bacterium]
MNAAIKKILNEHLTPSRDYCYGFADLSGLLNEKFKAYPYGISILRRLDDKIIEGIKDGPTPEYLNHYTEINEHLTNLSDVIARELIHAGIGAVSVSPTVNMTPGKFDQRLPDLRYDLSHKMVATRAGLGWIGKTDLFVSTKFGPRHRLASILINQQVTPEFNPVNRSRCGNCKVCVDKCPAHAATGRLWDIHTDRDLFFDAYKCREQCSEFGRTRLHVDRRICGICVAVCPIRSHELGRQEARG